MMVGSMLTTTLMGAWHLNVLPHAKVFSGSASTHELIAKSLFVSIKPPQLSKGLPVDVFTHERFFVYKIDFEVLDKQF